MVFLLLRVCESWWLKMYVIYNEDCCRVVIRKGRLIVWWSLESPCPWAAVRSSAAVFAQWTVHFGFPPETVTELREDTREITVRDLDSSVWSWTLPSPTPQYSTAVSPISRRSKQKKLQYPPLPYNPREANFQNINKIFVYSKSIFISYLSFFHIKPLLSRSSIFLV